MPGTTDIKEQALDRPTKMPKVTFSMLFGTPDMIELQCLTKRHIIHREVACHYSPILAEYFNGSDNVARQCQDVTGMALKLLLRWLYKARLKNHLGVFDVEVGAILELLLLVEKWQISVLHDIAINAVLEIWESVVEIPIVAIKRIYAETEPGHPLRKFVVELIALNMEREEVAKRKQAKLYPSEFLMDMVELLQWVYIDDLWIELHPTKYPFKEITVPIPPCTTKPAAESNDGRQVSPGVTSTAPSVPGPKRYQDAKDLKHNASKKRKGFREQEEESGTPKRIKVPQATELHKDLVKITVEHEDFFLHKELCCHSPYYTAVFKGQFQDPQKRHSTMGEEISISAFRLFISWLYTGSLTDRTVKQRIDPYDLYTAAILADQLLLPEFQNATMRKIVEDSNKSVVSQTSMAEQVYQFTSPDSVIRKVLIDSVASKINDESLHIVIFSPGCGELHKDVVRSEAYKNPDFKLDAQKYMVDVSKTKERAAGRKGIYP